MNEIIDIADISDSREVYEKREPIFFRFLLVFFCVVLFVLGVFSYYFKIEEYVYVDGIVTDSEPISEVYVKNSGEIIDVKVKQNEYVNKGDLLFEIDSSDIELQINREKEKKLDCLENIVMYKKLYDSVIEGDNLIEDTGEDNECYLLYQQYEANVNKAIEEMVISNENLDISINKLKISKEITSQNKIDLYNQQKEYESFLQYVKGKREKFSSDDLLISSMLNDYDFELQNKENELKKSNKIYEEHKKQLETYNEKAEKYKVNDDEQAKEMLNEINEKILAKKDEIKADKEHIQGRELSINSFKKDYQLKLSEKIDSITLQINTMENNLEEMDYAINNPELSINEEYVKLCYKAEMLSNVQKQIEDFQDEYTNYEYNISLLEYQKKSNTYLANCSGVINLQKEYNVHDYVVQNQLIMQVIPNCNLEMKLYIKESDRSKIKIDDIIYYSFEALPEKEYGKIKGNILELSDVISNIENGYFYIGRANIENVYYSSNGEESRTLYDGMIASAKITVEEKKLIVWIWEKIFN